MALQLKGDHTAQLPRDQVWRLLNSPQVLQEIIPGCGSMTRIEDDKYELGLNLIVGSVTGSYKGSVVLSEKRQPDYYDLALVGEGSIGFVKGKAHFVLVASGDDTLISYDGEAEVGGLVAGVGNRVLSGVAKYMVKRFFTSFDKYIKQQEQTAKEIAAEPVTAIESTTPEDTAKRQDETTKVISGEHLLMSNYSIIAKDTTVEIAGTKLRVRIEGREDKPWLMMSHSIATNIEVWDEQIAALHDRFHLLRFDTRGHGGSGATAAPYSFSDLVDDAVAVLDRFGIDQAHFMGVSLGGIIGYGLALAHPHRLLSLIASSSRADAPQGFISAWDERIALVRAAGMQPLAEPTVKRWFTPAYLTAHPDVATRIAHMISTTSVEGFAGCANALQHLLYLPDLGNIRVPTLLIAGAMDGTMPGDVRDIQKKIEQSCLSIISNAGHLPNVDSPLEFNRIISGFLP